MKKNAIRHHLPHFDPRGLDCRQSQIQKYLALESHPRLKERTLSTLSHFSATTSLMF